MGVTHVEPAPQGAPIQGTFPPVPLPAPFAVPAVKSALAGPAARPARPGIPPLFPRTAAPWGA